MLRVAVPAAVAAAGIDPAAGRRHRHRLHRLHDGPDAGRRHPAQRGRRLRRPAARLRQAVEAPRRPGPGRPDQRARPHARRGVAAALRRADLLGVGVRQGPQLFEEDREVYDRMDHWVEAADWIVWQLCGTYVRNACTAGYKGILQDGDYPSPEFLERAVARLRGRSSPTSSSTPIGQLGDRAGTLTAEAAAWTGLPEGIAVAVGNVDAHVTAPAAQAVGPGQMVAIMGTSTCHVMSAEVLREVPGHVRRRRRRHHLRALGLRGRPERRRRHLRLVRRARRPGRRTPRRPPRRGSRCTSTSPAWPPSRRSASTASSPSTGTPATARCWSTTSSPAWSSARPWPPAPRTSTARCSRRPPSAPA